MSYTAGQLSALREAYARGVLEAVLPDGSRIKYRGLMEMERIIATLEAELTPRVTHTNLAYPRHRRGFDR